MKILELNFEKGWRGGERQTIYCMEGLSRAGIEVALACRAGSALAMHALEKGFVVHEFHSIFRLILFLLFKAKPFDCLHAQTSSVLTYCVFTKPFHKAKVIYSRRVNFVPKSMLTRLKYRLTDKLFAISEAIQETLEQFTGRTDIDIITSIAVNENPDRSFAEKMMQDLNAGEKKIIATTAALSFEKDPFTALEAIRILNAQRNDFIFLHFGSGKLMDKMQEKINAYGLQDQYRLMGFVDEPQALFSYFDVFIMTSTEEGLGSSVLDAFMHNVPVVSTNAGGLKNLLSGSRGILCQTGDSQAIAAGIATMLQLDKATNPYIATAHQYVLQEHGMEKITQQYILAFQQLKNKP